MNESVLFAEVMLYLQRVSISILVDFSHMTYWRKSGEMPQICVACPHASDRE
jgi:hypothetical protein